MAFESWCSKINERKQRGQDEWWLEGDRAAGIGEKGETATLAPLCGLQVDSETASIAPQYGSQVDGETASHAPQYGTQVDGETASYAPQYGFQVDGEKASLVPQYGFQIDGETAAHAPQYGIQVDGETASHAPRYGLPVDGESASRAPQFDLLFDGETAPFAPHVQEVFEDPIFDLDPWAKCATSSCAKVGKSRGGRRGTRAIQIKNAPKTVAPMCASELWPMLDKRVPGFLPRGLFPDPGSRAGCERVVDAFEAFKCALLQIAWMAEGGSSGELAKLACHLEVCADCGGDEGCFDVDDELAKLGFAVPGDS